MRVKQQFILILCLFFCLSLACQTTTYIRYPKNREEFILFESVTKPGINLYKYDLSSDSYQSLTFTIDINRNSAFNPVTQKITFVSNRGDYWNLWEMDITGESLSKITRDREVIMNGLDWNFDGRSLVAAIREDCAKCTFDIYTMNEKGNNLVNITQSEEEESQPDWSPDGEEIVYVSKQGEYNQIKIMDKDGENARFLTSNEANNETPRWSPDGKQIAFASQMNGGDWDIIIMDADGNNMHAVTDNLTDDITPSWSPQGGKLIYSAFIGDNFEIITSDTDGTNLRRLTHNHIDERFPIWIIPEFIEKPSSLQSGMGIFAMKVEDQNGEIANQTEYANE